MPLNLNEAQRLNQAITDSILALIKHKPDYLNQQNISNICWRKIYNFVEDQKEPE